MTSEPEPPEDEPTIPPASLRTAAGYTLAGILLATLVYVLGSPLWAVFVVLTGSLLVGVGVYRRDARLVWGGLVGLAAGSLGVTFLAPAGAGAVVFLLVAGTLFALLATALSETGRAPAVRPELETRSHQLSLAGLAVLWLVLVVGPLAFPATRLALASDMGTTLMVLLVAGANVLVFGLPLVSLRDERHEVEAAELRNRGVRFDVRGMRSPDEPGS